MMDLRHMSLTRPRARWSFTALFLCLAAAAFASEECPPPGEAPALERYSLEDVLAGRAPQSAAIARATLSIAGEHVDVAIVTDAARDRLGDNWPPFRRQARLMLVALPSGEVLWELLLSPHEVSHETHAGHPRLAATLGAAGVLRADDGVMQRVYAGDSAGRVWRVDLPPLARAAEAATDWQVELFADLSRQDPAPPVRFSLAPDLVRSIDAEGRPFDGLIMASEGAVSAAPAGIGNGTYFLRDYAIEPRTAVAASGPVITWRDLALSTTASRAQSGSGWFSAFQNPAEVALYRPHTDGGRVFLMTALAAGECESVLLALTYVLNVSDGRPLIDTLPGSVAGVGRLAGPRIEDGEIVLPGRGIGLRTVSGATPGYRARFRAIGIVARVNYWRDLLLDAD